MLNTYISIVIERVSQMSDSILQAILHYKQVIKQSNRTALVFSFSYLTPEAN